MAFQIKNFRSISAGMINFSRANGSKITDFSVGSIARTLMEASAIEIEELYLQILLGLQEAIPVAVFDSFDFPRLPEVAASGVVRFTGTSSLSEIVIPAGTRLKTVSSEYEYSTQIDAVIAPGQTYVDALAYCTIPGAAGNCEAGLVTVLVTSVSGITSMSNALPFSNGADAETDAARKTRFSAYISTLSHGTASSIKYGVSQTVVRSELGNVIEKVAHAVLIEPYVEDPNQPTGLVNVYIHNGVGSTSEQLVFSAKQNIDGYVASDGTPVVGWKAAGVLVNVFAAEEMAVPVTATITMNAGASNAAVVELALNLVNKYILALDIGAQVIRSELIAIIMAIPEVYNVAMALPLEDVAITAIQKAVPGTVTLS